MSSFTTPSLTVTALTTTFTPPPPCLSDYHHYSYNSSDVYQFLGPPHSDCFPQGWASASQWFSPGICPSGYEIATLAAVTTESTTETQAVCCPSSYTYAPVTTQNGFYRNYSLGFSVFTPITVITNSGDATAPTFVFVSTFTLHSAINAFGVSILYQAIELLGSAPTSSSLPNITSSSPSNLLGSSPSTTFSISNTRSPLTRSSLAQSPTSTSTSHSDSAGLSPGAKTGIGTGV